MQRSSMNGTETISHIYTAQLQDALRPRLQHCHHVYIIYIYTHIHTYIQTDTNTQHTHTHTQYIHTYMHTYIHTCHSCKTQKTVAPTQIPHLHHLSSPGQTQVHQAAHMRTRTAQLSDQTTCLERFVYVCVYICIHTYVYTHTHKCAFICMFTHVPMYMYACTYIHYI